MEIKCVINFEETFEEREATAIFWGLGNLSGGYMDTYSYICKN